MKNLKLNLKGVDMVVYALAMVFTAGFIGYLMGDNYVDVELITEILIVYLPAILTGMGIHRFWEVFRNYIQKTDGEI